MIDWIDWIDGLALFTCISAVEMHSTKKQVERTLARSILIPIHRSLDQSSSRERWIERDRQSDDIATTGNYRYIATSPEEPNSRESAFVVREGGRIRVRTRKSERERESDEANGTREGDRVQEASCALLVPHLFRCRSRLAPSSPNTKRPRDPETQRPCPRHTPLSHTHTPLGLPHDEVHAPLSLSLSLSLSRSRVTSRLRLVAVPGWQLVSRMRPHRYRRGLETRRQHLSQLRSRR